MFQPTTPSVEHRLQLHRLKPGERGVYLLLSNAVSACNTHWTNRTRLCVGSEHCPACFVGLQPRWIGYVPVETANGNAGLLEVTASSGHNWLGDLEGREIMGLIVSVERRSQHSGIMVTRHEVCKRSVTKPWTGEDVFDAICRLLQLPRRRNYLDGDLWRNAIESAAIAQLKLDLGINVTPSN